MKFIKHCVAAAILGFCIPSFAADYYVASGDPATGSSLSSSILRAEYSAISSAFAKVAPYTSNANKAVVINSGGTGQTVTTGTLGLAGNFATTGAFNTTLIQGATTSLTLPLVSGTLATLAGTETLTNKTLTSPNIVGTTTNNNAAAGSVGEYISSTVPSGSATSLTTSTPTNISSMSLTAGDWDVEGIVGFLPGATTNITVLNAGASIVSATSTPADSYVSPMIPSGGVVPGNVIQQYPIPKQRISLSGTTTVYLVAGGAFTVSTLAAYGTIRARRIR